MYEISASGRYSVNNLKFRFDVPRYTSIYVAPLILDYVNKMTSLPLPTKCVDLLVLIKKQIKILSYLASQNPNRSYTLKKCPTDFTSYERLSVSDLDIISGNNNPSFPSVSVTITHITTKQIPTDQYDFQV